MVKRERRDGGDVEIPQSPIEWPLSQQDGEQSPLPQEVLPGSPAASRFAGGNPAGPGSSHPLPGVQRVACSALHPWAGGGEATSAPLRYGFQEREGVFTFSSRKSGLIQRSPKSQLRSAQP